MACFSNCAKVSQKGLGVSTARVYAHGLLSLIIVVLLCFVRIKAEVKYSCQILHQIEVRYFKRIVY